MRAEVGTLAVFLLERELQLDGSGGMLFGPENGEQARDPDTDASQAVKTSVAAGADG